MFVRNRKIFMFLGCFVFIWFSVGSHVFGQKHAPAKVQVVVVRKGQCLYKIARAYRIKVSTLMRYNGLKSSKIFPGQKLKVPLIKKPFLVKASWYGPKFHGRKTANGERYNMHALTAAHKVFPLGTLLKISYQDNSVIVKINDRGPYVRGRELDLSFGAAKRLGLVEKGVVWVSVMILQP